MTSAVMPTYARIDIAFERGEGPYLFATDGRRFLDFCAGIAVNSLGHSHPKLVSVLQAQAARLWHTSNLYRIPEQERLAALLTENSFADLAFFCNSGVEAVEGGIKLCRKYHAANGQPQKWRIITFTGSFHGRTLTALAAQNNAKYLDGFGPKADGFDQVTFGNTNELRAAVREETAAILVEPVQGEGGIRPADAEFLRALRAVCDEYGLLLYFDEVQCGMGRTGKLWAHEWAGVTPDVMALAKGIAGGFPMGAFLATAEAAKGLQPGTHGSTFGGNQLASSVGAAVVETILEDGFLPRVQRMGHYLRERLDAVVKRHPAVFQSVRGAGLMLGIKCAVPNADVVRRLREGGLLTVGADDNIVRLLPPLTIEQSHADEALAVIERVASGWGSGDA
ncbi:MAG: aspartate aminotransferase family protein [Alphaproteobacteria bacterium]